jgi:hypothetical protein
MRNISTVKRVEFVSNRKTYKILSDSWCDIVLKVHIPTEEKLMI